MENNNTENNSIQFETLLKRAEDYGKVNIDLLKYKSIDKFSDLVSLILARLILMVAIVLFALFLSAGAAYWLGEYYGKTSYGVFIVSGFYGVVAIISFLMRENIKNNICNSIITKAFNKIK